MHVPSFRRLAAFLLAACLAPSSAPAQTQDGPLFKVADYHLKTPRLGAAAVAGGNYIYIIAGQNRSGILGDIERFDVNTHQLTTLTNKLTRRHHHGAALIGGKIYAFGGGGYEFGGTGHFEEAVDIYDIASGKITDGAPMPDPRGTFATASLGAKIYVMGGTYGERANERQTNRTAIYDTVTNSWSEGIPMPTRRDTRAAVALGDGIIVAGGHRLPGVSNSLKTVEAFDSGRNRWYSLPDLGEAMGANSAAVLGKYLFLFGNYDPADEILAYDLKAHTSVVFKDGFTPASQTTAVELNGLIYVIGGTGGGGRQRYDKEGIDDIQVFALSASAK
jgi:Kelch motif